MVIARCDLPAVHVAITPHAAYHSEEAIGTVRHVAAEEVVRVLKARWSRSP